ncbi:uncharacterized protein EDB91DRAFT_1085896 [Suillus paluster]|uniref:uncharacterized protein n=1 Tax=Suillus paluster TaxID=48578 RepID=UPI001B872330|nr:uncharacterized protein EDB91DRAFT_1085896 [Suillus paluster]KAG1728959.1 hypothetical protein EDB91DRAFT_1085896 [Suillus paluster]
MCRQLKVQCSSGIPPVSIDKGKKRELSGRDPISLGKGKEASVEPGGDGGRCGVDLQSPDHDRGGGRMDGTNRLLKQGIAAAEGSQAAMDRFVEEQRAFQALFLEGMRNGFRAEVAEEMEEMEEEAEGGSGARVSGGDMETDDL